MDPESAAQSMSKTPTSVALVEADDLWSRQQIAELLVPLKKAVPRLQMSLYTIPNHMGSVRDLKEEFPWINFYIHGWEHSFAECASWTDEQAIACIEAALQLGYDPCFKPPQWICDRDLEIACAKLDVVLHHHESYDPVTEGLQCYPGPKQSRRSLPLHEYIHTHIQRNPATDFITECPAFDPEHLLKFNTFVNPRLLSVLL